MIVLCVSENRINSMRTAHLRYWSGRKGHENLPFAGV